MRDTEEFLLLNEWISSPYLSAPKKRDVLNQIFGEEVLGKNATQELGRWTGFVDWSGLSVYHLLAKKELRPVCAWGRSEEHTSELQSLMRISYAVFFWNKKIQATRNNTTPPIASLRYTVNSTT